MKDEKVQTFLRVVLVVILTLRRQRLADNEFLLKVVLRILQVQAFLEVNLVAHPTSKVLVNAANFFVVGIMNVRVRVRRGHSFFVIRTVENFGMTGGCIIGGRELG